MRRLAARSGSRDDLTRRNETWLQSRRQPICQPLETRTTAISAVLSYRQCFINCVRLTSRTGSPGALAASATSSGSGTRPGSVGRPRRRSHPCSPDYATLVHSGDPAFPEICAKMPRPLDTPRNSTRISGSHCCSHEFSALSQPTMIGATTAAPGSTARGAAVLGREDGCPKGVPSAGECCVRPRPAFGTSAASSRANFARKPRQPRTVALIDEGQWSELLLSRLKTHWPARRWDVVSDTAFGREKCLLAGSTRSRAFQERASRV
jgi:hypothetical protein